MPGMMDDKLSAELDALNTVHPYLRRVQEPMSTGELATDLRNLVFRKASDAIGLPGDLADTVWKATNAYGIPTYRGADRLPGTREIQQQLGGWINDNLGFDPRSPEPPQPGLGTPVPKEPFSFRDWERLQRRNDMASALLRGQQ